MLDNTDTRLLKAIQEDAQLPHMSLVKSCIFPVPKPAAAASG